MYKVKLYILQFLIITITASCKKDFLNKTPSSNIIQPSTLDDFQRLLDNQNDVGFMPALPQLSSDDYYFLSSENWEATRTSVERSAYIWEQDVYGGAVSIRDWNIPYKGIFYANSVLAGLEKLNVEKKDEIRFNNLKGSAHFIRAVTYFELLKSYSKTYDETNAYKELGVPIRIGPSVDEIVPRSTIKVCYDQIFNDLLIARNLLTLTVPNPSRNRPTKLAVYALLSRIYMSRRQYDLAERYTDSALNYYNKLIDYNSVSISSNTPFLPVNDECIYRMQCVSYTSSNYLMTDNSFSVDSTLIRSYTSGDLRMMIYFSPLPSGKGYSVKRGYNGSGLSPFCGLATDELYLIKSECAARAGSLNIALLFLNDLLVKRYKTGTYVPIEAQTTVDALQIILKERRKSLVWRGLRWDDLKRLNKEGANITLTRVLGNKVFQLFPNDPRYIFNIPADEISYSGIEQNNR